LVLPASEHQLSEKAPQSQDVGPRRENRTLKRQRAAAPTAKPTKSLVSKLPQWYYASAAPLRRALVSTPAPPEFRFSTFAFSFSPITRHCRFALRFRLSTVNSRLLLANVRAFAHDILFS
jgi:hypothetical protein